MDRYHEKQYPVCVMWAVVLLCVCVLPSRQLEVAFYDQSCPSAESIVKEAVREAYSKDRALAPDLVRMQYHDCFVRGCDGSVLLDSTPPNTAEKDSPVNNPSLEGFEIIDDAKARLESACKGVVSCADIIAFAARDSIEITGGPSYDVPAGRRDGRVSLASEALTEIPKPNFNLCQLTKAFANKGLSQEEMVTLAGAHTIGQSHCTSFSQRLYNFNTPRGQDPTLDPTYATHLKQQCPRESVDNPHRVVPLDTRTPSITDVGYYRNLLDGRGLFTTDQSLLASAPTASQVLLNAHNETLWKLKFVAAIVKMGQIGAGNAGEVRANCRVINS